MNLIEYLHKRTRGQVRNHNSISFSKEKMDGHKYPDEYFDAEELAMGIEIEKEHTNDEIEAKNIAKNHLLEISDYYSRLKNMEDKSKNNQY